MQGIGVTNAIAIGTALVLKETALQTQPEKAENPAAEVEKLTIALTASLQQVGAIMQSANTQAGEILASHLNFLQDPAFNADAVAMVLEKGITAIKAVQLTTKDLRETFLAFDEQYMRERAVDIEDVGQRIIRNLMGEATDPLANLPTDTILLAHDLVPSQTAQLDKNNLRGFVTEAGGKTSHTAIMARAMQIAAVVGCTGLLNEVQTGDVVVVNALSGQVVINPSEDELNRYKKLKDEHDNYLQRVNQTKNWRIFRQNGTPILVGANIGSPAEAITAKANGADGIGLFRTEFLYMDRAEMPSEEEQFEAYKTVAETFGDAPVIIRTLDIGGDKQLPYLPMTEEENPFLGVRAIRLCMKHLHLFRTQLRALLRAAQFGNLKIMFPMISSMAELDAALKVLEECKAELTEQGIPCNPNIGVGIMIEIPAAALIAEDFAKRVEFFSIGTNDLTQYTLAVDRGNPELNYLYDSMHPAVLMLIKNTIQAAHRNGIICFMCGEMAGDSKAIPILAGYGLDEYSVGIDAIGQTKVRLMAQPEIYSPDDNGLAKQV